MRIKRFCAENFRNIEKCDISFLPGVNLLYGNNAQGKTNAVEGIYVFARGKSFRASDDRELCCFGKEGFRIAHDFLVENAGKKNAFCMPGFILKNTLSENGGVSRGLCRVDAEGNLVGVTETHGLIPTADGAASEKDGLRVPVDAVDCGW